MLIYSSSKGNVLERIPEKHNFSKKKGIGEGGGGPWKWIRDTSSSSILLIKTIKLFFEHLLTIKIGYICIILQKKTYFYNKKKVFCWLMHMCLNSVRLETPNINEIFFLNYSKHLGLQFWLEDRLQITGGRWLLTGDRWQVTGDRL